MTPQENTARRDGQAAEQALDVINPAIESLISSLVDNLKAIPIGATEQILSVHAALSATQKVKQAIIKIIADGQLAEHALMQADILKEKT